MVVARADVKGDAYEGLLQKNAEDVKGGAGQYFTPRPLIRAIVDVMQPQPGETICDPACGTGGFLLARARFHSQSQQARQETAHVSQHRAASRRRAGGQRRAALRMNLLLHGIGQRRDARAGDDEGRARRQARRIRDRPDQSALRKEEQRHHRQRGGRRRKQSLIINRDDFWASTSNKQLNFLQHVFTILKQHGRAAVVVPDNVLFEGGAGETVRRELLKQADVHTLLRLPTGIFYAQGVKANVLFFDRKPAAEKPWTEKLWIYDLRTNMHFTLKENPLKRSDLDDFVACYNPKNRHERKESERFKSFTYEELIKRDKLNLDIFWLKDEVARRQRQPSRSRHHRRRNRRRPPSRPRPVRRNRSRI